MSYLKEVEHLQIPLHDILIATDTFSKEKLIARGGFGLVYQGQSEKHGKIAVKRLDCGLGQGDREFMMEISLLSAYKHENIVSLFGFCSENGEKILVYKHERNGSLDKHLKCKDLTWIQRLQICLDAACGLKYLHDDVGPQHRIIHRDIKSSNILLDENWKAKISDFGLSKVGPANVQHTFLISNVCGTPGYVDPEYVETSILTEKIDVYSFGVVLFEVLCGRLAYVIECDDQHQFLSRLGQHHYEKNTLDEIIDSDLREQINSSSLSTFTEIAYRCLKKHGTERPKMSLVVEQLQQAYELQKASDTPIEQTRLLSWDQNVFISSRGEDISKTLVDHLKSAFVQRGIHTYTSDQTIDRDKLASPSLLKDIQESRVAIIVFSENCLCYQFLDEVAYIMECMDERGQIVKPIFYGVDYLQIQKEVENCKKTFSKHELENSRKVGSWEKAVMDANNISGWVLDYHVDGHDLKCIGQIVDNISFGLLPLMSSSHTNLVGLETRLHELKSLLDIGSDSVRMVGIWGIGGSGKSASAYSIYKEICHEFDSCCFVENVREESSKHGFKKLQEFILLVLKQKQVVVRSIEEGKRMINSRSCSIRVLIVLDDVDHLDQLEALAGSHDWFGKGSRIIITSRNKHLLNAHRVDGIYSVSLLFEEEVNELFSRHTFGQHTPRECDDELSRQVGYKVRGHPLACKTLGSFLRNSDMNEWETNLNSPIWHHQILENLRISYDGLEPQEKELFLEIVCLTGKTSRMLVDEFGFDSKRLNVLIQKALVYVPSSRDYMHDFVKEMGHYILQGEPPNNHSEHHRTWQKEDVLDTYTLETMEVVAKKVRFINWDSYSESMLPTNFQPMELRYLILQSGSLVQLWEGYKHLPSLKVLNLDYSNNLIRTPDFHGLPCLERMTLRYCESLKEIDPSIGYHERLIFLDVEGCPQVRSFPPIIRMIKLETLILTRCYRLTKFPEIRMKMENLVTLCLKESGIKVLPTSIGRYCTSLVHLDLRSCVMLKSIQGHFRLLKSLKELYLKGSPRIKLANDFFDVECCLEVLSVDIPISVFVPNLMSTIRLRFSHTQLVSRKLPHFPRFLRRLNLSGCSVLDGDIPSEICELSNLEELDLSGSGFSHVHSSISVLPRLKYLNLSKCDRLVQLPLLPLSIAVLDASDCNSLKIEEELPTHYKWLWKVSLWRRNDEGGIGVERVLQSMLQGKAAEDYFMDLKIRDIHNVLTTPCTWGSKKFTLQLPVAWYNDFSGFLVCFARDTKSSDMIMIKQEMSVDSECNLWNEFDNTSKLNPTADVGYVSFNSLRHTTWWNEAHTKFSFSLLHSNQIVVSLVPRKGKGGSMESAISVSDSLEFWDQEFEDSKTFRIRYDSKYAIGIEWRHHPE